MSKTQENASNKVSGYEQDCPECGGMVVDEGNESVCTSCYTVVERTRMVRDGISRETRAGMSDKEGFGGTPTTNAHHANGLGSRPGSDELMRKQSMHTSDNTLRYGISRVKGNVDDLSLPNYVEERACRMFRRARKKGVLEGRSVEGVAAACVRVASVEGGVPRLPHDVGEFSDIEENKINTLSRKIRAELGLGIGNPDPAEYVPRIVEKVGLGHETEAAARRMIDDTQSNNNKAPSSIAASAVYAAVRSGYGDATMEEVSEAANVSCPAMRGTYDGLMSAN